ncbi:hypothetical protein [Halobacillus trueperi]|uniref:hypothetical protein n=1 Tax=Halobacillus trueperi TaxID=156205 RepID=UPI0037356DF5
MVVLIYMVIGTVLAFFLGIIPEGFGNILLLGAILGVLVGIYHQLFKIQKLLTHEKKQRKPQVKSSKIPIRR